MWSESAITDILLDYYETDYAVKEREKWLINFKDYPDVTPKLVLGGVRGMKLLLNQSPGVNDPLELYTPQPWETAKLMADKLYELTTENLTYVKFSLPHREIQIMIGPARIATIYSSVNYLMILL